MPALMGMRAPPRPGSHSGRMIREPARRSRNARSSKDTNTVGQFLTFTAEELKALDVESSKVVDLEKFVAGDDIDPVYFDSPYFVYPDGPIAVEVLRVIGAAMAKVGVVGLGRLTLSRRERMVVVEPRGNRDGRCLRCALQVKFGYRNSAAPRAISMPRWWQSRGRSSGSGPAISTRAPTATV